MTVGVNTPLRDPFSALLANAIHDAPATEDVLPILLTGSQFATGHGTADLLRRFLEHRVDGITLRSAVPTVVEEYLEEVSSRGIPLVVVDEKTPHLTADFVGTDDEYGGREAAPHLLHLGHRNLAHIAGNSETSIGRLRQKGFFAQVSKVRDASCMTVEDPRYGRFPDRLPTK